MLIRCKLPEFDNIELVGKTPYHFKKNTIGHLVCDVEDADAARYLLSKDIYEPYDDEAVLQASTLGDVADLVLDDDDEDFFDEPAAPPPGVKADPFENATLEELQGMYKEKFGKAAHPSAKYETLLAKLKGE